MENTSQQLKEIIIAGLRIKDRTAADLSDDQQLLGGDLEIDSIDILQLIPVRRLVRVCCVRSCAMLSCLSTNWRTCIRARAHFQGNQAPPRSRSGVA